MKSVDVTLTPVQTMPGLLTRSTVFRHILSVTTTYLPSRAEDGPITITSIALGDLLSTQLGSDDFVSALQENESRIVAIFIGDNAVTPPQSRLYPSTKSFSNNTPH